jgi:hypothetical protein
MKCSPSTLLAAALITILGLTISAGAEPARQSILGYHADPGRSGNFIVPSLTSDRATSLQLDGNFAVLEPPFADEGLAAGLDLLACRGVDHIGVVGADLLVQTVGCMRCSAGRARRSRRTQSPDRAPAHRRQ